MSMDIVDLKPSLLEDLKKLYKNLEKDNNNDYNVTIKVEQKSFRAHSVILKLRSGYFRNLINNEIRRMANMFNRRITLEISDINSEVFASCLKYIYTGEFSLQEDNDFLFDLFIAAETLKLIDMKLVEQLERFYLVREATPPPNALPPRTPRRLKRNISTYSTRSPTEPTTPTEPRLQRKNTLAKVPIVVNRPSIRIKPISSIINIRQMKRISHWIDRVESGDNNNDFFLLAKGTWDSMTKIKFHNLCDNKGPTLILARIDNTNDIIGGYNPHSWTSSNQWIGSTESFIFSFKSESREGIDDINFSRINNPNAAIFDGDSNLDVGFGSDLSLFSGEYKHVHYQRRIMNCDTFTIKELEVFQIRKNIRTA
ncbi:unnamed protein product [Rhizophagus irregularis]|uniref:Kelch-like protein 17 n=1 Tax=Rhizophagus irregularis TaxID=588596 RepID=A0A915YYW6_9GLOM|nr:unnamed protein product [Rhizophagus irregularis]